MFSKNDATAGEIVSAGDGFGATDGGSRGGAAPGATVLDGTTTTHADGLASLMTLNFQEFENVSLLAA